MGKSNEKVVFHLGLHKTGTSFLQKNIFPYLENVCFIDRPYFNHPYFDIELDKEKINVISGERYSGVPHLLMKNSRFIIAKNLKILFPDARIIIGIRETQSWLGSCYTEAVKQGCFFSYNEWFEKLDSSYLEIDEYIIFLKELFPEVFIYNMEDFIRNKSGVIENMCNFIGCSVPDYRDEIINMRLSKTQLKTFKYLNRFLKSNFNTNRKISQKILLNVFRKLRNRNLV